MLYYYMKEITPEEIWNEFVFLINKDTFSEHELMQGKHCINLLGSIKKHKKLFLQAFENLVKDA